MILIAVTYSAYYRQAPVGQMDLLRIAMAEYRHLTNSNMLLFIDKKTRQDSH